ncbi:metallophosphoesterase family protein [Aurantiacibacter gangjinensis]|uniref:Uncharacterized protein n=1 Tax=Aurantiacibacter gangjinensis TaxID=502682 RepID=A0A0G9MQG7_9SPHN|nr:metallophosphoesterase [Aurantiacibacter gangjinensis]APE27489.1 putative DNA repair exonuclease [Aurantiacibacter gangjinensis]KLE31548.1 hypothetical protein AAW01_08275 [Aurantiacibacter gangjinensis]
MSEAGAQAAPDRIMHVSDVHFGVENPAAMDAFAASVEELQPDAVICTGDITQRAFHGQWDAARKWFAAFDAPVMVMPGNHDMPYGNLLERFRDPYKRFGSLEDAVGREISLRHAVIVPLDTNVTAQWRWPWSDGVIKQRKLDATLERLGELADDPRMKIVACHHPLLPATDDRKNPTIRGDMAFAALARAGANAVMSGHVHVPFDLTRSREGHAMRMIGAGTLSRRLRGAEPSWNLVTITPDRIAVEPQYPLEQMTELETTR